jgi:hypothetical protein
VRWPPACEDVSQEAEDCLLLEDVTSKAVKTVTETTSFCVTVMCKVCNKLCVLEPSKSVYQSIPLYSHTLSRHNIHAGV